MNRYLVDQLFVDQYFFYLYLFARGFPDVAFPYPVFPDMEKPDVETAGMAFRETQSSGEYSVTALRYVFGSPFRMSSAYSNGAL